MKKKTQFEARCSKGFEMGKGSPPEGRGLQLSGLKRSHALRLFVLGLLVCETLAGSVFVG